MKQEAVALVSTQTVLGKEFRVYGTAEEPVFIAKDVAKWIDYAKTSQGYYNVSKMLETVDDDEKFTITIRDNDGRSHQQSFLTEDGLYELLMQSRKPIAKAFKKEVKRILHDLRVHGTAVSVKTALASPEEQAASFQRALESAVQHAFELADSHYKPQIEKLQQEKAWISEKREATAMQTASVLQRRINRLEAEKQEMVEGYDAEIDNLKDELEAANYDARRYWDWRGKVGRHPKGWISPDLDTRPDLF